MKNSSSEMSLPEAPDVTFHLFVTLVNGKRTIYVDGRRFKTTDAGRERAGILTPDELTEIRTYVRKSIEERDIPGAEGMIA